MEFKNIPNLLIRSGLVIPMLADRFNEYGLGNPPMLLCLVVRPPTIGSHHVESLPSRRSNRMHVTWRQNLHKH